MTEKELVQFEKTFGRFKEKRILLYGDGNNAKAIVERYDDSYRLLGLLSFRRVDSILFGKHTFGEEDLEGLSPDLIIATEKDEGCKKLLACSGNIPIYDLEGKRLDQKEKETVRKNGIDAHAPLGDHIAGYGRIDPA